jgi:hypothetical protein
MLFNYRVNFVVSSTEAHFEHLHETKKDDLESKIHTDALLKNLRHLTFQIFHNNFNPSKDHPELAHIAPLLPPYRFEDYDQQRFLDVDKSSTGLPQYTNEQVWQVSLLMKDKTKYWGDHYALRVFSIVYPDLEIVVWGLNKSFVQNRPHLLQKQTVYESDATNNVHDDHMESRLFRINLLLTTDDAHYQLLGKCSTLTTEDYSDYDDTSYPVSQDQHQSAYFAQNLKFVFQVGADDEIESDNLKRDDKDAVTEFVVRSSRGQQNYSSSGRQYDNHFQDEPHFNSSSSSNSNYSNQNPNFDSSANSNYSNYYDTTHSSPYDDEQNHHPHHDMRGDRNVPISAHLLNGYSSNEFVQRDHPHSSLFENNRKNDSHPSYSMPSRYPSYRR